jgi:hypothetical protein
MRDCRPSKGRNGSQRCALSREPRGPLRDRRASHPGLSLPARTRVRPARPIHRRRWRFPRAVAELETRLRVRGTTRPAAPQRPTAQAPREPPPSPNRHSGRVARGGRRGSESSTENSLKTSLLTKDAKCDARSMRQGERRISVRPSQVVVEKRRRQRAKIARSRRATILVILIAGFTAGPAVSL